MECSIHYTGWVKKLAVDFIRSEIWQMLTDCKTSFTFGFSKKFAIQYSHFSATPNCEATLPYEM